MSESRGLRALLRFYVALFGAGAVLFVFFSKAVVDVLNAVGDAFGMQPLQASYAQFWIPLAGAYMVVIMELAWAGQNDRGKSRAVELLVLAKATSSVIALGYFVVATHAFAFLANFAVDGAIAVVTYWLHRQVKPASLTQTA